MTLYIDKYGQPINDVFEWARLCEDRKYATVKQEQIGTYFVSTVWIGLGGPPGMACIFESMVFQKRSGGRDNIDQARYLTLAEAEAGHELMASTYRKKVQ